ncbi:hypothetical protein [Actinomycetospora atypica]|uniref:Uncharacterized protein n=1 Tax=Actinomycetospora atypica TaxID=1290095 RepID=A0ABV9YM71_9PSEU
MSDETGGSHRRPDAADGDAPTPPAGTPTESGAGSTSPEWARGSDTPDDPTVHQDAAEVEKRRGGIRYQDPETTTPREPTVAEKRARNEAERRRRAQEEAAAAAAQRKSKTRKRLLIGGGVAVGIVAVVAIAYAASSGDDETTAQCVDQAGVVVPDEQCSTGVQQGGYYSGGTFVPIFLGGFGGGQYHYNYGSNAPVGSVARGGTVAPPASGTSLRGTSGSSIGSTSSSGTVSRGGLGVGGSSSGGSSSGGSSSSGS